MKQGKLNVSDDGSEVAAIEDKSTIRSLWFRGRLTAVDFSTLPGLVEVGALGDVPDFGNLRDCLSVRRLRIVGCRLRDLTPLAGLAQLEELEVEEAPLKSLAGIEELTGLRQLHLSQLPLERLDGLGHATKLETLDLLLLYKLPSLREVGALTALKKVSIDGSKRAADVEALGALTLLEELELVKVPVSSGEFLSGLTRLRRLILDGVGTLPSLAFLVSLTSLEHFKALGNTRITDGDVSVLLQLPRLHDVRLGKRPHYSHSGDEIRYVLAGRWTDGTGSFENAQARRVVQDVATKGSHMGPWSGWFDHLSTLSDSTSWFADETVPADYAQAVIAATELVAHGGGHGVSAGTEAEAIASWCERLYSIDKCPRLRLVVRAIGALDRIVREPSELARLWRERGDLAAWLAAVADLRGRLELTRASMSRTYGIGSFDNEPALRYVRDMDGWSSSWSTVGSQLYGMSFDSWREGHPMIPAFEAQAGIAMAEAVAHTSGHGALDSPHAAEILRCAQKFNRESPSLETIDRAIKALDRIVREPSELLQYWTERGELAAWLAAVAELRARLELARAECTAAEA